MSCAKKDRLRSWIYLILTVFTSLPITGAFYSFGIFVDIFLEHYDEINSKAGWIGSVLLFSQGISSLIGVYLFRYFGLPRVMLASAVLVVFSFAVTPRMPTLESLFLTYSISFGVGFGLYECITVITLGEFFDRYLGLSTGIRYAGAAGGPMIFSYLIPVFFDVAGWNTMMTCFSGLGIMFVIYTMAYKYLSRCEDTETPNDIILLPKQENKVKINLLQASKSLLKEKRVLMILTGNALFSVVEYIPNMFMIPNAKSLGYSLSKSKWMLVAFSSVSIVSRSVMGFVADYAMKRNIMRILLSALMLMFAIFSAFCSFTQSLTLMIIYMGGIGALDGMYWVLLSLVAMEISHGHADIMFTLMLFATAFGYLIGPPAIGWLYDATGNFSQVLYAVSAGAATAGVAVLGAALLNPSKIERQRQMARNVKIATSELKKCTLIVVERETVV